MPGEFISSGILLFTGDYSSTDAGPREPSQRESSEIDGKPEGRACRKMRISRTSPEQSARYVVRCAGRFVLATSHATRMARNGRAAWSLATAQFNSSIQFHVLELILNRIPKGTCRLRVQQSPVNKLRHMHVTIRMSLSKLDIQCPPLLIIPDGFDCRRIESDPLRHSPY